jgi:antitoxin component of MazEF toxin-antitoxin module
MVLLMKWQSYVRKNGATMYISLPPDYVKAHQIDKDDLMTFFLNPDGSITLKRSDEDDETASEGRK